MHLLQLFNETVTTYWSDIILILGIIAILTVAWKRGSKAFVYAMVYDMVLMVEEKLRGHRGAGDYKRSVVSNGVYQQLPRLIRLVYTRDDIDKMIVEAVTEMRTHIEKIMRRNMEEKIKQEQLEAAQKAHMEEVAKPVPVPELEEVK